MRRLRKRTDLFEERLEELKDVREVLQEQGKYSGECSYLEIVAELLISIYCSLSIVRTFLAIGFGVLVGHIISAALKF